MTDTMRDRMQHRAALARKGKAELIAMCERQGILGGAAPLSRWSRDDLIDALTATPPPARPLTADERALVDLARQGTEARAETGYWTRRLLTFLPCLLETIDSSGRPLSALQRVQVTDARLIADAFGGIHDLSEWMSENGFEDGAAGPGHGDDARWEGTLGVLQPHALRLVRIIDKLFA